MEITEKEKRMEGVATLEENSDIQPGVGVPPEVHEGMLGVRKIKKN